LQVGHPGHPGQLRYDMWLIVGGLIGFAAVLMAASWWSERGR